MFVRSPELLKPIANIPGAFLLAYHHFFCCFVFFDSSMTKKKHKHKKGKGKDGGDAAVEEEEAFHDSDASSDEEETYVKPDLPWAEEIHAWMGGKQNRIATAEAIRQRYLATSHSALMTGGEWLCTAEGFMGPYKPRAELMVQLLCTTLCKTAVRRGHKPDNPAHFAAALRWQKSEVAFEKMAGVFEANLDKLDMSPSLNLFFHAYGLIKSPDSVIPGIPHVLKYMPKGVLARKLVRMDMTKGNAAKSKFAIRRKEAREQKTHARWSTLGSLFTSEGCDANGLVADKVNIAAAIGAATDNQPSGGPMMNLGDAVLLAKAEADDLERKAAEAEAARGDGPVRILQTKKGGLDADEVDGEGDEGNAPRKRRTSAVVSLLTEEERQHFDVKDEDTNLTKVSKLAILEGEFDANVMTSTEELALLWNDADTNGNGDMSMVEWQAYTSDKFTALGNPAANRKAFFEAAIDADPGASKQAGFSMPVLNRSNFKLYLNRCFEYNKVKYAFDHLDTSGDDRVVFAEFKARRNVFFKMLELDPKCCIRKMTIRDEFDMMAARIETEGKLTKAAIANGAADAYINYHGMAHFYRQALGTGLYGTSPATGPIDENDGTVDTTGTIIDIDEFQDMILNCHYKTRNTAQLSTFRQTGRTLPAVTTPAGEAHLATGV